MRLSFIQYQIFHLIALANNKSGDNQIKSYPKKKYSILHKVILMQITLISDFSVFSRTSSSIMSQIALLIDPK